MSTKIIVVPRPFSLNKIKIEKHMWCLGKIWPWQVEGFGIYLSGTCLLLSVGLKTTEEVVFALS
jgi:hypothetical protein